MNKLELEEVKANYVKIAIDGYNAGYDAGYDSGFDKGLAVAANMIEDGMMSPQPSKERKHKCSYCQHTNGKYKDEHHEYPTI